MDSLGRRAQLAAALDKAMERAQKAARDRDSGQHGLFGVFSEDAAPAAANDQLPDVPDWDEHTRLSGEKEMLGFFITGHPLEKYRDKLLDFGARSLEEVSAMKLATGKDELLLGGVLSNLRVQKSKKGELYAQGTLEDTTGKIDFVVFSEPYRRLAEKLKLTVPVLVRAGLRVEEGAGNKLTVGDITPLEEATPKLPRSLRIRIPLESAGVGTVDELHALCAARRGEARVLFDVERAGDFMVGDGGGRL